MIKVSSTITINNPIEEVFEYMASPHNGPAFIPNLSENTNIVPKKNGIGQKFDYRFNFAGVDLKGKSEVTEYTPPTKVVISTHGGGNLSTWTYILKEANGGTNVFVEVDFELSETVIQRITNKMLISKIGQRTTEQMLEYLKIILEE